MSAAISCCLLSASFCRLSASSLRAYNSPCCRRLSLFRINCMREAMSAGDSAISGVVCLLVRTLLRSTGGGINVTRDQVNPSESKTRIKYHEQMSDNLL
ncbi:hypothetical protein Pcinc_005707 [Petrolisthes cinctipes]|uniref:Secreted protein n=1 Tax=Petrolisthes cinctipes TaxID=88211 RepID=A0AAE1GCS6_PETCI|nr:hypothetical protein Pcinc_005707 [Petrolisthes cinctipes]